MRPGSLHVLLTGGTSGIGFQAAQVLLQAGHRLTLPCRDRATADSLQRRLAGPIQAPVCDLADLTSVTRCAEALLEAGEPIDSLVLNAGLQYSGASRPRWSAQGFELTVAVNHLAHQALLQRLLPLLRQASTPRLVVTSSEVHDPSSAGGRVGQPAGLADLDGLRQGPGAAMLDGSSSFNAEKAYKDSKLCNLLMARQASQWLPVLAWSPGLVIPRRPGGFFRDSRSQNPLGQAMFALAARDLLRLTETAERAGALLASLGSGAVADPPGGFAYWSNRVLGPGRRVFELTQPSVEAQSDGLAATLWQLSAQQLLQVEVGAAQQGK